MYETVEIDGDTYGLVPIHVVKERAANLRKRKPLGQKAALSAIVREYGYRSYDHYYGLLSKNYPQYLEN